MSLGSLAWLLPGLQYVPPSNPRLQNQPGCGLTTGGKDECFFDCEVSPVLTGLATPGTPLNLFVAFSNPDCLFDCYSSQPSPGNPIDDFCITSLLRDVHQDGICDRPLLAKDNPTPIYPAKEAFPKLKISPTCTDTSGTCSSQTKALLSTKPCLTAFLSKPVVTQSTLAALVYLANCVVDFGQLQCIFEKVLGTGADADKVAEIASKCAVAAAAAEAAAAVTAGGGTTENAAVAAAIAAATAAATTVLGVGGSLLDAATAAGGAAAEAVLTGGGTAENASAAAVTAATATVIQGGGSLSEAATAAAGAVAAAVVAGGASLSEAATAAAQVAAADVLAGGGTAENAIAAAAAAIVLAGGRTQDTAAVGKQGKAASPKRRGARLNPVHLANDALGLRTELDYSHTRHRYPWICSLRSRSQPPKHLCAVTFLSLPPNPVVVGAAHCTYLCKDSAERLLPSCCCHKDRPSSCTEDSVVCSNSPRVVKMEPGDADILCGEWQTGDVPSEVSGEEYNIKFEITEVVRHPRFNQVEGPIGGFDIAVFKTHPVTQGNSSSLMRPACLPPLGRTLPTKAIHSGWTDAPPFHWLQRFTPTLLRYYSDFFKQWHYQMDIEAKCDDTQQSAELGSWQDPLEYPSHSLYPAGTMCAKHKFSSTCFAAGDSGSPLMAKDGAGRFYVEGFQSFVKGCDSFYARSSRNSFVAIGFEGLSQINRSPSIYTRLSCFLPWVAEQYGLSYPLEDSQQEEQRCHQSTGSKEEEKECRTNPESDYFQNVEGFGILNSELKCIFPFYYKGKKYTKCMVSPTSDFVFQVVCPIANSTSKIDGVNNYGDGDIVEGFCSESGEVILDNLPNNCTKNKIFRQCKNNCPGAQQGFGIVGGGSLVLAAAAAGGLGTLSALPYGLAGLGVFGMTGVGALVARGLCVRPFCTGARGRCCLLINTTSGTRCPRSC